MKTPFSSRVSSSRCYAAFFEHLPAIALILYIQEQLLWSSGIFIQGPWHLRMGRDLSIYSQFGKRFGIQIELTN
jgi:hypothetical protein